jgi:L-serine deaminase
MDNLSAGICASWLTNLNQRHIVPVQRDLSILNQIILNVSALMEIKIAMEAIVAAPTAGSCGGLPGAIPGAAEAMGCDEKEIAKAFHPNSDVPLRGACPSLRHREESKKNLRKTSWIINDKDRIYEWIIIFAILFIISA